MNLDQIETKCFILALFIRDDGERFLLGSRAYEFVDSQLHFVANSYQNDIVEVQGNDGVMLAGQVRRGTSQPFDGYIGDQTVDRSTIEQYRRDFMKFFRKNHYYKVVYVFPDGSAVQRRNGFIVEAPEVKELYQLFPQYHISMNFEDINYYVYEEDSDGQEIYGESATLKIATSATGGLIWEEGTESEISGEGSQFTLQDTIDGNVLDSVQLKGDTTQQTYSGKNILDPSTLESGVISGTTGDDIDNVNRVRISSVGAISVNGGSTYTVSTSAQLRVALYAYNGSTFITGWGGEWVPVSSMPYTFTTPSNATRLRIAFSFADSSRIYVSDVTNPQLELGSATPYEPYVGGIPAPNPDYPQTVNNVTGRQTVTITDGASESQSYEVNLGKNLYNSILEQGGIASADGTGYNDTARVRTNSFININANTTYSYSSGTSNLQVAVFYYKSDGTYLDWSQWQNSPVALTAIANTGKIKIVFRKSSLADIIPTEVSDIQIEKGSTASSYAPYISHFGKNMLNLSTFVKGRVDSGVIGYESGTSSISVSGNDISFTTNADNRGIVSEMVEVTPSTEYTFSGTSTTVDYRYVDYYDNAGTWLSRATGGSSFSNITFTTPSNCYGVRISFRRSTSGTGTISNAQIEAGSTATSYQQFIGGQLELCKIGNYQDYIYKSGDNWYVHKTINKSTLDGTENWSFASGSLIPFRLLLNDSAPLAPNQDTPPSVFVNYYGTYYWNLANRPNYGVTVATSTLEISKTLAFRNVDISTLADWKTWLSTHNTLLYYPLATATDIQITDSSLIAQLEALLGATTYDGQTVFTVSSANQLAILDVTVIARTGGGVVWDNYGAEWEEGTGGGPTTVNVDSIDNVYPVLTLTGPAVNPQISVLTTNTTLSYSGTVTSSQELKIDMFNKTATLNGASVVGNVSGDWVYLKPGVNRITYTTNNADAPDSTIWWQEIVG